MMVLEIESARGAMTGARYIESLRDNREVWLDGAKVTDVASHPAMTGMVHELARMVELLREVSGSGLIMQPSEGDLANPEFRPYLDRYMPGKGVGVEYKSRLFRLAHDLAVSSFGMRQEIYEYWHGGDPNRNRINLLRTYDQAHIIDRIKTLISKPLRS